MGREVIAAAGGGRGGISIITHRPLTREVRLTCPAELSHEPLAIKPVKFHPQCCDHL